mgnify:CR=1 FL=1
MKKARLAWLLSLLLLAACVFACGTDDEDDGYTAADYVNLGKKHLTKNEGVEATEAFQSAIEIEPRNVDANFGLQLAHTQALFNLADTLVNMVEDLLTDTDWGRTDYGDQAPVTGPPIGESLQAIVRDTVGQVFTEADGAYKLLLDENEIDFFLSRYNLVLLGEPLLELGGEFDKTDLHALGALAALLTAVADLAQGLNLDLNLNAVYIPEDLDLTNDPEGFLQWLLGLLDALLSDDTFDQFLALDGTEGVAFMQSAGVNLGNAFARLAAAFEQLGQETDAQDDDQFTYQDTNDNGTYDALVDPVQLGALVIEPAIAAALPELCRNLSLAFWEGSAADPNPLLPDKIYVSMLDDLLIALGVIDDDLPLGWLGLNVGRFFAEPSADGLRGLLLMLLDVTEMLGL